MCVVKQEQVEQEKSYSLAAFICGLFIWVPLFNVVLGPLALLFGIIGMRRIKQDPKRYGGAGYALTGIILGSIAVVFTLIWAYVSLFHPEILTGD